MPSLKSSQNLWSEMHSAVFGKSEKGIGELGVGKGVGGREMTSGKA